MTLSADTACAYVACAGFSTVAWPQPLCDAEIPAANPVQRRFSDGTARRRDPD